MPASLLRVREVSDLFVDICVREPDTGNLLFLSIFGRDGAMLNFFASFSLPTIQGGLAAFHLVDAEGVEHVVNVGKADNLTKHTGKLPAKGGLFGNMTQAWLYDRRIQGVDRANRSTWALFPMTGYVIPGLHMQLGVEDRVWQQIQDLSPLPLPDEWRGKVMDLCRDYVSWLDAPAVLYPPLGPIKGCRIGLPDAFMGRISEAVRAGDLRLPRDATVAPKLPPLEPIVRTCATEAGSAEDYGEADDGVAVKVVQVVNLAPKAKFRLGRMVTTRAVHDSISSVFVMECIARHQSGDWGELSAGDKRQNDNAVKSGEDRMLSSYLIPEALRPDDCRDDKLWVITEWDRSVTTVLFPSDY
jgi:hypothetical protein